MYREREILPIKLKIRTTPFLLKKETGLCLLLCGYKKCPPLVRRAFVLIFLAAFDDFSEDMDGEFFDFFVGIENRIIRRIKRFKKNSVRKELNFFNRCLASVNHYNRYFTVFDGALDTDDYNVAVIHSGLHAAALNFKGDKFAGGGGFGRDFLVIENVFNGGYGDSGGDFSKNGNFCSGKRILAGIVSEKGVHIYAEAICNFFKGFKIRFTLGPFVHSDGACCNAKLFCQFRLGEIIILAEVFEDFAEFGH